MRILSYTDLKTEKGIRFSRQHIYRLIAAKKFPRPIPIGENTRGWLEDEIDAYILGRVKERDAVAA